jgi:predicted DNA-binding transcriptional regulator AlpA
MILPPEFPMTSLPLAEGSARRLIDAKEAGRVLGMSWRTVLRHADAGRIPPGFKLGALRRWDAAELDAFIAGGCKPLRTRSQAKGVRT